jgi:hypothetical protein
MPWQLDNLVIEPERIRTMQAAYYKACAQLGLSPAPDSITEILVTKIVDLGTAGDVDPTVCASWRSRISAVIRRGPPLRRPDRRLCPFC